MRSKVTSSLILALDIRMGQLKILDIVVGQVDHHLT